MKFGHPCDTLIERHLICKLTRDFNVLKDQCHKGVKISLI